MIRGIYIVTNMLNMYYQGSSHRFAHPSSDTEPAELGPCWVYILLVILVLVKSVLGEEISSLG